MVTARSRVNDIRNRFEPTHSGDGSYTVPKRNNQPINDITQLESPPRGQAVFNVQQDTVEQAMRTGEEVNFINSKGESISIKVIPVNDDANGNYNVTIDGHTVSVSSEIGISSTIAGITNMIEFGSAMGMPEGVRQFPDALVIKKDVGPEVRVKTKDGETVFNAGARYTSDHQLIFYGSEQWIHDAELYYHEIGHGLGRDINSDLLGRLHRALNNSDKPITAPSSMVDANPYGWQKIHDAEAFAAYIHAKNHGEVALQQFRETFPLQAEYIDKTIFGQSPG